MHPTSTTELMIPVSDVRLSYYVITTTQYYDRGLLLFNILLK